MKKKIILTLTVVALFVFVLSLSVSAVSYVDDEVSYTLTEGATEEENTATINNHKSKQFTNPVITIPAYIEYEGEKYYVTDANSNTTFEGTNLKEVYFDPDCRITRLRNFAFKNCKSLTKIVLPSQLEKIHWQAFFGCNKLTALYLPDTITEIGYNEDGTPGKNYNNEKVGAFFGCSSLYFLNSLDETTKPTVWYAPANLTKLSGEGFKEITTLNPVMVFGENFIKLERGYVFANKNANASAITLIFKGDFTQEGAMFQLCCEMKNRNMYFTHPNVQDTSFFTYDQYYFKDAPTADIYFCSNQTAYTMKGTAAGSSAPTYTEIAFAHTIEKENVGVYYSNYFEKGYILNACYCGEELCAATATLDPVFTSRGVSVPTFEGAQAAVTQGIKVNREALNKLEGVDFGLVVDVNLFGEAYCPISSGATTQSLLDREYDYFDIKVSGIPAEYCDTAIVFCAYVSVGDEIFYLDDGATYKTVTGVSYNSLKGKVQ